MNRKCVDVAIHSREVAEQADKTPRPDKGKIAEDVCIVGTQIQLKGEGMEGNSRKVRINGHQADNRRGKPPKGIITAGGMRELCVRAGCIFGGRDEICCE